MGVHHEVAADGHENVLGRRLGIRGEPGVDDDDLAAGVVIFVVACPSQWTSVLAVCAYVGSAASVSVAAAPIFRKSRRSMWGLRVSGVHVVTIRR